MSEITNDKSEIIRILNNQISIGEHLLRRLDSQESVSILEIDWESWKTATEKILEHYFTDNSQAHSFLMASEVMMSLTLQQKRIELNKTLNQAIEFLKRLISDIENGLHNLDQFNTISSSVALEIIRRILNNFHKHLESMYQNSVHGNGTIKKEDLDRIQIGNEYDVQRILYALIRPIFPEARMEVTQDTGYKSIRYDIFLDEYNTVIEVKCSRPKMKERDLTEELGADAFHYQSDYLFAFVYDKEKIIKNADAFKRAYKRDKSTFGKDVDVFVVQSVTL